MDASQEARTETENAEQEVAAAAASRSADAGEQPAAARVDVRRRVMALRRW